MAADHPIVLLLTHHRDYFTVDRVAAALEERGARPLRVNTDLFPGELHLSTLDLGEGPRYLLDDGDRTIEGDEVAAVWTRSFWPPRAADEIDPTYRDASLRQARLALEGFLDGLAAAHWVSPLAAIEQAKNKLCQHRLARHAGLTIPQTLVSNDPRQVRDFFEHVEGRMVTKLLWALSHSMERSGPFMPTSDVSREDLDHLDSLRYGPMIFQEKVSKAIELRAMYVAGHTFTGAIDARESAAGTTDWRLATGDEASWQPAELPEDLVADLRRFMNSLDLLAGAIDLIRTPDGEYIFLEVNPLGEWGMLEKELDLPISAALAEALLASAPLSDSKLRPGVH